MIWWVEPNLWLRVINVGDGACSVLGSEGEMAILDCGSWRSSGEREAGLLTAALGRQLKNVSTLLVSHFDADHWRGLQRLPSVAREGLLPERVRIQYPGLPELGRKTVMAYLALAALSSSLSVRALDLLDAWRPMAEVDAAPLFAGDFVSVGSFRFDVVWPPRLLPDSWSSMARRTLDELEQVAHDTPSLRRALDDAYAHAWPQTGQVEAVERDNGFDYNEGYLAVLGESFPDEFDLEVEADLIADFERREPLEHAQPFGEESHGAPNQAALRDLARRLGKLNNHLSLVLASPEGHLLAPGDVQGWSLRRVCEVLERSHYYLALAPHHGTVKLPGTFPPTDVCMLQNGPSHFERRERHQSTHPDCTPVSTEEVGNWSAGWYRRSARSPEPDVIV